MSDHPFVTVPALAGSGFETPAALGVPTFAGIALRPVPRAVAAQVRPLFGSGSEQLDEVAAAERLAACVAAIAAELQPRLDALAGDLLAARRLVDDAQKLARKPDDLAVGTIAAHRELVAGSIARHTAPLPTAVDRVGRLGCLDPVTAPLAHHAQVRDSLAELERHVDGLERGHAELTALAGRLGTLLESATTARAGTIADLQARLAAAEARAGDDGGFARLQATVAALCEQLGELQAGRMVR